MTIHTLVRRAFHKIHTRLAEVRYRCNICGAAAQAPDWKIGREDASCPQCGSTVRMRAVIHHVSMALFGKSIALPDFPERRDIHGVGLSDWLEYAQRLAEKLSYTNTYYHQEPFLDITSIPQDRLGSCDFIISSDVFEHVAPPVSRAFTGSFALLKPGGTLVLTVPFATERPDTREHFPHLHQFEVSGGGDTPYRVTNTREDGTVEHFDQVVFHGGPGTTLEMREFARDSLQRELTDAGFTDIRFERHPVPKFGIYWPHPWSIPIVATKPRS